MKQVIVYCALHLSAEHLKRTYCERALTCVCRNSLQNCIATLLLFRILHSLNCSVRFNWL